MDGAGGNGVATKKVIDRSSSVHAWCRHIHTFGHPVRSIGSVADHSMHATVLHVITARRRHRQEGGGGGGGGGDEATAGVDERQLRGQRQQHGRRRRRRGRLLR